MQGKQKGPYVFTYKHIVQFVIPEVSVQYVRPTTGCRICKVTSPVPYPVPVSICRQHKDQTISLDFDKVIKKKFDVCISGSPPTCLSFATFHHPPPPPSPIPQAWERKKEGRGGQKRSDKNNWSMLLQIIIHKLKVTTK